MNKFRFLILLAFGLPAMAAPFGTVVPVFGGASDIVLDEARGQVYLPFSGQNLVQVYSLQQQTFQRDRNGSNSAFRGDFPRWAISVRHLLRQLHTRYRRP